MNILFLSHLSNKISAGPNWSVPASVNSQAKIDNVLWINLNDCYQEHWGKVKVYHKIQEYGKLCLNSFPSPFNRPDLVVFEGFYCLKECFFARKLRKQNIPYIIVPRGSLTKQALHNGKYLKKFVAHLLWFNSFTKHALAIQYLTESEYQDSTPKWNKNHIIIPNGCYISSERKNVFSSDRINAIYIGRLDLYHKGLDLLLNVCCKLQEELRKSHFSLKIYGPIKHDYLKIKQFIKQCNIYDIVSLEGEIFGVSKKRAILDSDIMFLTSRFEGHPMGLIETLSYGIPCLITRGTNMLLEVKEYDAGWVCETSEEDIIRAFRCMLSERSSFKMKGNNAYKLAENYNWDILAEKFHSNISELIQSKLNN